jgi:SAM-dependent methyltransferase
MSDQRYVDSPPAGAEGWREVWEADARYRPRASVGDWFLSIFRRLFRRAVAVDAERQRDFNITLLDLVRDLRTDLTALRQDLKHDLDALQVDVRSAHEALATELKKQRDLLPVTANRNDALIAAIDQKIESISARLHDLTLPVIQAGEGAGAPLRNDFLYRRLEDGLRGTPDVTLYLDLAKTHQPAIDIGCGRGEFLLACREAGVVAFGFDINERSVAHLRARGVDAAVAGIPDCFTTIADQSVGAVLAIHVVEHIPAQLLFELFAHSHRVLKADGLLMIETPNAESLLTSASDFWRDPTHLAPRHPAALTLLAREYGFAIEEIRAVHPLPEGNRIAINEDDPPALRHVIEVINDRIFGPQDLRLILRRN